MKRTSAQNLIFHALIKDLRIDKEAKMMLVREFSGGREESSANLTLFEMKNLIKALEEQKLGKLKKMRSKIINIAKDIGLTAPQSPRGGVSEVDWERLNKFLVSKFKKPLSQLNKEELRNACTALERWRDGQMRKELGIAP